MVPLLQQVIEVHLVHTTMPLPLVSLLISTEPIIIVAESTRKDPRSLLSVSYGQDGFDRRCPLAEAFHDFFFSILVTNGSVTRCL